MFNSIVPNIVKPNKVRLKGPNMMLLQFNNEEDKTVKFNKGVAKYLYKILDIKESTSKDVFKKSTTIWGDLIQLCANNQEVFNLNNSTNIFMLTDTNDLVDLFDTDEEENYNKFVKRYDQFKLELTEMTKTRKIYREGAGNLIKLMLYRAEYDIVGNNYTPIAILELNSDKSEYKIYTGIFIYNKPLLILSNMLYNSFNIYHDLVNNFNLTKLLDYIDVNGEALYNSYLSMLENENEISVRELLSIISKVGYKLELNSDNDIGKVDNLVNENSEKKLIEFFNTFKFTTGETAVDIINLSNLRKIFRYNKLTLLSVLEMLSDEYINCDSSKVTAEILIGIINLINSRTNDKKQLSELKGDLENANR